MPGTAINNAWVWVIGPNGNQIMRVEMVVIDLPHIYPFANQSTDGRGGMENVYGIPVSECRVINRVCQQNKVCRQH